MLVVSLKISPSTAADDHVTLAVVAMAGWGLAGSG
jgi:hypothetical protein